MVDFNLLVKKYGAQMSGFFRERISEIEAEIEKKVGPLLKEKSELLEAIKVMENSPKNGHLTETALNGSLIYSDTLSNMDKAVYFARDQYFTLTEIAEKIHGKEPSVDLEKLKGSLSAVFAMDADKGSESKLTRKRNENNKWIYKARQSK